MVTATDEPDDAWTYYRKGSEHYKTRNYNLAVEDFGRAIALDGTVSDFWMGRGRAYAALSRHSLTLKDMAKAIMLAPNDSRTYGLRAAYFKSVHCNDAALADYDSAIAIDPGKSIYHHGRGLVLWELKKLHQAVEELTNALEIDPENASYYYDRSRIKLYDLSEMAPEQALPDLEEAIRLNPHALWYRFERGSIRYYQSRWAEAAEDFAIQDIPGMCGDFPFLGAKYAVWTCLARKFQGKEADGLRAVQSYLEWHSAMSPCGPDSVPFHERRDWPVPFARYLAGEIDGEQLRATPSLSLEDPDLVPSEVEYIQRLIMEYCFFMGQTHLAQGLQDEALAYLLESAKLPASNSLVSRIAMRQIRSIQNSG